MIIFRAESVLRRPSSTTSTSFKN